MSTMQEAARDFLAQKSIAVVGVSRNKSKTANFIYRKLRSEGYQVFAVNPNATTVEGDVCYHDLKAIAAKPDGVVIVTKPQITDQVVRECAELGVARVWMHQGVDKKATSVSEGATIFCRENGITVIPGSCPMMYCNHADLGHRFMKWLQGVTGNRPKV